MALSHLDECPSAYSPWVWNRRFDLATAPWHFEGSFGRILRISTLGALSGAGGILGAFTAAFLLRFLITFTVTAWYFVLARIRELSIAVRGRPPLDQ